jgi:hypothetical protein
MDALVTLTTWAELHQKACSIYDALSASPRLALAAAANPIFALQDLGYQLAPSFRQELEDRLRFRSRGATRLQKLRASIYAIAGHRFDIGSAADLARVLVEERGHTCLVGQGESAPTAPLPWRPPPAERVNDPLEAIPATDPIREPLLEYRRLDASSPRLAERRVYDGVLEGTLKTPIVSLRVVPTTDCA